MCSSRNRLWTCQMIAARLMNATQTCVSVFTFLNCLQFAGLNRPYVQVPLTVSHQRLRLNWARGHYPWSRRRWNRVLFMDDSRFIVQFADGRLQVWRWTGESMDENNIVERDRYGGRRVMIWGGILVFHSGKTCYCEWTLKCSSILGWNHHHCCDSCSSERKSWHFAARQPSLPCCLSHNVQPFYSRATFRHSTGLCIWLEL